MATAKFAPFATLDDAKFAADFFGIDLNDRTVEFAPVAALGKDGGNIMSLSGCGVPCDVTLDSDRPETWARAVYEAGVRIGRFADFAAKHQDQSILRDFPVDHSVTQQHPTNAECLRRATAHADGIVDRAIARAAQQPASKPECKACYKCGIVLKGVPLFWIDGHFFCSVECMSKQPPPPTLEQRVAALEARLTPPS